MYSGHDPLYAQRLILSANRGSLLELGLSPIITASMFLQTLESAGIVGKYGEGDINSNDSSSGYTINNENLSSKMKTARHLRFYSK